MKKLKRIIFVLGCIIVLGILWNVVKSSSPKLYIKKIEVIETNEKVDYCVWEDNKIIAVLENGKRKTICELKFINIGKDIMTDEYRETDRIHFKYLNDTLYIYDDGKHFSKNLFGKHGFSEEEHYYSKTSRSIRGDYIDDGRVYGIDRILYGQAAVLYDKAWPRLFEYDVYNGRYREVAIPQKNRMILQDIFLYDGDIQFLADFDMEKKTLSSRIKYHNDYFYENGLYISMDSKPFDCVLAGFPDGKGISPLKVKGFQYEDQYYFPTIEGIAAYHLSDRKLSTVVTEENENYDRIWIFRNKNYFYEIKRKITGFKAYGEGADFLEGCTIIKKYDLKWKLLEEKGIQFLPETINIGSKSVLFARQMSEDESPEEKIVSIEIELNNLSYHEMVPIKIEITEVDHREALTAYSRTHDGFYYGTQRILPYKDGQ